MSFDTCLSVYLLREKTKEDFVTALSTVMLKHHQQLYSILCCIIFHFPDIRETKRNRSLFKGLFKGT